MVWDVVLSMGFGVHSPSNPSAQTIIQHITFDLVFFGLVFEMQLQAIGSSVAYLWQNVTREFFFVG